MQAKTDGADEERETVESYWESFADDFEKIGTTQDELVNAFEVMRKKEPTLTADKFLNLASPGNGD